MTKRILNTDPLAGTTTWHHYDEMEDMTTIETSQDVTDLVESNKSQFNDTDERDRYGEMTRVASIPMNVYFDLKKQGILGDQKKMKAWLNNSDNRFFRTRPGKI